MNPDEEKMGSDQPKPKDKDVKVGPEFFTAFEDRKLGVKKSKSNAAHLQALAEDCLVRKEFTEMKCEMPGLSRSTFLMVFSPDGSKVASTHGNHNIYVTDVRTGKTIKPLVGHPRTPWCIAFHPTSNQIVASGCLGGQVRIWDLSGGSEVWTTGVQNVIASLAFHPNDRILVIATFNEVYFWDWSKPEPFVHTATNNPREKVRYVAFDKLGHRLITGISNSPLTRWERVRAPVPVPRQAERSASPYRRRITPRLVTNLSSAGQSAGTMEALSDVAERERRISASYRNLVHEYEVLVHRYLQVYCPPTMVDRGTDPMEFNPSTSANPQQPSTSSTTTAPSQTQRSTPQTHRNTTQTHRTTVQPQRRTTSNQTTTTTAAPTLIMPSELYSVRSKPRTLRRGTQTGDVGTSAERAENPSPRRLVIKSISKSTNTIAATERGEQEKLVKMRIKCSPKKKAEADEPQAGPSGAANGAQTDDKPNKGVTMRKNQKVKVKRLHPNSPKKPKWWTFFGSSSDSSSSDEADTSTGAKKPSDASVNASESPQTSHEEKPAKPQPTLVRMRIKCSPKTAKRPKTDRPSDLRWKLRNMLDRSTGTSETIPPGRNSTRASPNADSTVQSRVKLLSEKLKKLRWLHFKVISGMSDEPQPGTSRDQAQTRPRTKRTHLEMQAKSKWKNLLVSSSESSSSSEEEERPKRTAHAAEQPTNYNSVLEQLVTNLLTANESTVGNSSTNDNVAGTSGTGGEEQTNVRISLDGVNERPSFAQDEVINYSERVGVNEEPVEREIDLNTLASAEPRSDVPSINPENIGIGNMYLNIVQDLESSVDDVYNIRESHRPGETSDMLSSFSVRLENIMAQADVILRNLRQSMDTLSPRESERQPEHTADDFYVRDRSSTDPTNATTEANRPRVVHFRMPYSRFYNPATQDHTYPRSTSSNNSDVSPLMASLHLTVSHIQRQASLLRQQVESIELIDRAMLEVSQMQVIRQLFLDMSALSAHLPGTEGVSSVRQMMAGTRISDPSPHSGGAQEGAGDNGGGGDGTTEPVPGTSRTANEQGSRARSTRNRSARKTYPPSRFFRMQRQGRRPHLANFFSKRYMPRDARTSRRPAAATTPRPPPLNTWSPSSYRTQDAPYLYPATDRVNLDADMLGCMQRRLQNLLMDQLRHNTGPSRGEPNRAPPQPLTYEPVIRLTLMGSRLRINRLMNRSMDYASEQIMTVTQDGETRSGARHALSLMTHTLSRYFEDHLTTSISTSLLQQLQGVLHMGLLLTEVLLLRIIDSIPPPTGMNVDPERETLTAEIDRICIQILNGGMGGHNQDLVRSVRLMRQTVLAGSRILLEKYAERRNAMMRPSNETNRRELVDGICRFVRNTLLTVSSTGNLPREWSSQLSEFVARINSQAQDIPEPARTDNSNLNAETGELLRRPEPTRVGTHPANTSDENDDTDGGSSNNNNNSNNNARYRSEPSQNPNNPRSLYRTNNVNLLNSVGELPSSSSLFRPWNVPTVHVNDVPVSESNSTFNPRIWTRYSFRDRYHPEVRSSAASGLFRPRFLHPLYAGPFDVDMEQREQMYDTDMITTVTPNHRIQVWDMSNGAIPSISNPLKNVVVKECKIHNDASVDIASDGSILVTLLPSGGYLNVTNKLGVYSLRWETLGQCLYITSFEQNAVSVSLSPLSRHLVVGLASRRVSIVPSDRWTMARIFHLGDEGTPPSLLRQLEQNRDSRATSYKSVNCIRWLPFSGQGLIYATNTGQLIVLT